MPDIFVDPDFKEPTPPPEHKSSQTRAAVHKKENSPKPQNRKNLLKAFQSYCENPKGIIFKPLGPNEEILLFLRAHPIINIPWITIAFLLAVVPIPLIPLLDSIFPSFLTLPVEYKIVSIALYFLIILGYILINFLRWFYNIGIVTNENIVDLDYTQVVQVHLSATVIEKVEDVSYKQSGFIQTLFNYGNIDVQTAGTTSNIEFFNVPEPDRVVMFIQKQIGHL